MRFELYAKDKKERVHAAVMPRLRAPQVVCWGHRSFVLSGEITLPKSEGGEAVSQYVEVEAFRIA